MADPVKFSEEELGNIKAVRDRYSELKSRLGDLKVQRILIDSQYEALDNAEEQTQKEYKEALQSEQKLVTDLDNKYGRGNLDLTTGIFTPFEN